MSRYTESPWQGGDGAQTTRLWAHVPGGNAVIIADFSVSKNMRHEEQVGNCRRARAAVRFVSGLSTEQIEAMIKHEVVFGDVITRLRMMRNLVDDSKLGEQAKLTLAAVDRILA